jgi:predicted nuclease of predicted toxin-antitoxin system
MKIIVDKCLSPKRADSLKPAGIEARHWSSIGLGDAQDSSLVSDAQRKNGDAVKQHRQQTFAPEC